MPLSHNDLNWFAARLSIAVYEANRITPDMSAFELREALRGVPGSEDLTISRAPNGNQVIHLGDRNLEVGPTASNDEIITALQNPFIRTENTKLTVNPFDRLKDKLAKASGVAQRTATAVEAEADALIAREDALKAKTAEAFSPHKAILDQAQTELDQVENALNQMTNGGPA